MGRLSRFGASLTIVEPADGERPTTGLYPMRSDDGFKNVPKIAAGPGISRGQPPPRTRMLTLPLAACSEDLGESPVVGPPGEQRGASND